MRTRVEKYKKAYPDISRDQRNEVQYMLDDLLRAEGSWRRPTRRSRS